MGGRYSAGETLTESLDVSFPKESLTNGKMCANAVRREKAFLSLLFCRFRSRLTAIKRSHTATEASISFWDSCLENKAANSSDSTISILRLGENTLLFIIKVLSVQLFSATSEILSADFTGYCGSRQVNMLAYSFGSLLA